MHTHHAYLLYASNIADSYLPKEYTVQTADISHVVFERMSIDDVRALTTKAQGQPFLGAHRVFVLQTRDIAVEAQNALLKLFEEPPTHAIFYLVVPPVIFLLPTLRSRLCELEDKIVVKDADKNDAFASFLSASYALRLNTIAEKTKEKDSAWIEQIAAGAERIAEAKKNLPLLRTVLCIRTYLPTKGASSKMLLEELALQLPEK